MVRGRFDHSTILYQSNKLVVFGGRTDNNQHFNDIIILDTGINPAFFLSFPFLSFPFLSLF